MCLLFITSVFQECGINLDVVNPSYIKISMVSFGTTKLNAIAPKTDKVTFARHYANQSTEHKKLLNYHWFKVYHVFVQVS